MSKKLYETLEALRAKCEEYFKTHELVAPRSFRIYIGLSKQTLSNYKKTNPEYFNLIKTYEDRILATVEELAIYGASHPILKKHSTSKTYNKDGELVKEEVKFNQVGAIFTLRAYDKDQYIPEQLIEQEERKEPIVIEMTNTSTNRVQLKTKEE